METNTENTWEIEDTGNDMFDYWKSNLEPEQEEHPVLIDMGPYEHMNFDFMQEMQIQKGLEKVLDVSLYAKKEYDFLQMEQIRLGLEESLDVSSYAKPEYDHLIMKELRQGIIEHVDLFPVLVSIHDGHILRQIRLAKKNQYDLMPYVKEGYDAEQLEEIRLAMEDEVDIFEFLSTDYFGTQLREIRLGVQDNVDVAQYATGEYNWFQMREIRLGMEEHLAVEHYLRPLLKAEQMEQIRIGLEQYLDVDTYSSIMLSTKEMKKKRLELLAKPKIKEGGMLDGVDVDGIDLQGLGLDALADAFPEEMDLTAASEEMAEEEDLLAYVVHIEAGAMLATLELEPPRLDKKYTVQELKKVLNDNGVKQGIDEGVLKRMIEEKLYYRAMTVARGKKSVDGVNGYFEFLFPTSMPTTPKQLEDGSVDYFDMKLFEYTYKGTELVRYYSATPGQYGYQVTGKLLSPKRGMELPPLRGRGFTLSKDKKRYYAALDGKVALIGTQTLEVTRMYMVDGDVNVGTGNINFNGDVYVKGDVMSGFAIIASGDVCIDGHAECVDITSGGSIVVKKGMHGSGSGYLRAAENINGGFFEASNLYAGGDIGANYVLNCHVESGGRIIISGDKGVVLGGKMQATGGIDVGNAGNKREVKTEFQVGVSEKMMKAYNEICGMLKKVDSELQVIRKGKRDLKAYDETNNKIMELKRKVNIAYDMKKEEYDTLQQKRKKLLEQMNAADDAIFFVHKIAYLGIHVMVNDADLILQRKLEQIYFGYRDHKVVIYQPN